ncbi:unnamed protein product [Orchesella dallaii]|uniref:Phospholipid scramblase n=1 Tax=Orchesella dallaii TaxID=48710 RepID=A0ABP1QPU1_9HEXA
MNTSNNNSNPFPTGTEGLENPGFVEIELDVLGSTDAPTIDDVASLNQVTQTANTFGEALRQAGTPVRNELDLESRLYIERDLRSVHFDKVVGFTLIPKGPPCHQIFTLSPITMRNSSFANRKIKFVSGWGCFFCFLPDCLLGFQRMTLKHGNEDVLSFFYRPRVWSSCQRKHLRVEIYVPQELESIGTVIFGKTKKDKTVIIDRVSQSVFYAVESTCDVMDGLKLPRLLIENNLGTPVAGAEACTCTGALRSTSTDVRDFTDYDLLFSPHDASIHSASARAVLTVGIALWVLERRESSGRGLWIFFLAMIVIFVLAVRFDFR